MRSVAIGASLALLTLTGGAQALTVDYTKLPQADAARVFRSVSTLSTPTAEWKPLRSVEIDGSALVPRKKKKGASAEEDDGPVLCFTDGRRRQEKDRWSIRSGRNDLRIEQLLVGKEGRAELLVQNIVVESNRSGVMITDEKRLPLVMVAQAPTGVKVFAMRDERDAVQFVVSSPQPPKELRKSGVVDNRQIILDETGSFNNSNCGHVRVTLEAKRRRTATSTVRNTVIISKTTRPHGATADVRLRGMYAHLSVSKLAKDKRPLVSVSFGWATAESIVEANLED